MDYNTWQTQLQDAGLVPHECSTPVIQELTKEKINNTISCYTLNKSNFTVNVSADGVDSISFYSANGRLKEVVPETFLPIGSHTITWNSGKMATGVYFVEIKNWQNITRGKIIL